MPHLAPLTGALGRRRRPGARLAAFLAIGVALAIQAVPPLGSAHADPPPPADLSVVMTGVGTARPGATINDSAVITNNGAAPASGVEFDLGALPLGATYGPFDASVATCVLTHCTLAQPLAPAAQLVLPVVVHTGDPLDDGDLVEPALTLDPSADNTVLTNDAASFQTELSNAGTLGVVVRRTSAAQLLPGQRATFTITLTNSGLNAARSPRLEAHPLTSPASTHQSASATGATCRASGTQGVWACTWPTIPAGESRVMTFAATASVHLLPGSFPVLAEASSVNSDGAVDGAWATVVDNHARATDVSVTTYSTPRIKPDKQGSFRVTVTNHGPYRAHDVVLTQTVPKGFYWKDTKGRVVVAHRTRTATFQLDNIEVGGTRVLYGSFHYPVGATLTWSSRVTHSDPDLKAANNVDSSSTRILGPIVKTVSTAPSGSGTVVKTTSTSHVSAPGAVGSGDATQVSTSASDSTSTDQQLADTGGPALRFPLLGLTLVLLGLVTSLSSRTRRPAPRHRAWISPYA